MTRRRKPTKAQLAAWEVDRLDPDNYFRIPEFGVMPADVDFKGFEGPIVVPRSDHYSAREEVRDLVRSARQLARATFGTLAALQTADAAGIRAMAAGLPPSPEQRTAMLYVKVCGNFRYVFEEVQAKHFILEMTWAAIGFAGYSFWDSRFGLNKGAEQARANRKIAKAPRGRGKNLTVDQMIEFLKANPGQKYEWLIASAVEKFDVSEATASRRYDKAKQKLGS